MAVATLQAVFSAAAAWLNDPSQQNYTNAVLQPFFNEPYRRMYMCLAPVSKRIQRVVYTELPALTTVLIPGTVGLTDFSEPELLEERPAQTQIAIATTDTSTPVNVTTAAPHGLGPNATEVPGQIGGVVGSFAPWGNWYVNVTGTSSFSLNGSQSDGNAGTGGYFMPQSMQQFVPMSPIDLAIQGIDGQPQSYLGVYMWNNEQLQFRGSRQVQQLRITYWASGSPPSNGAATIGIDNCIDFLAAATAANAAQADGFMELADRLNLKAYGNVDQSGCTAGLIGSFLQIQVVTMQRGPQRRIRPFRDHQSRFGNYLGLG